MNYALSFLREGSDEPAYSLIPTDTPPEVELQTFFGELDRNHVDHSETGTPGVYRVTLFANQVWSVRVIRVGDDGDTEEMEAVELGTEDTSK